MNATANPQQDVRDTADSLRAQFSVERTELPSNITRLPEYDARESEALGALADAGVEPETVRELYGAFEKFSLANVGAALTDEQLDGMYRTFAPKVGGDVAIA